MLDLKRWLMVGCLAFGVAGCGHDYGGNTSIDPGADLRLASETATTKPWGSEPVATDTSTAAPVKSAELTASPTAPGISPLPTDGSASVLAQIAASLAPGQSRKVPTSLTGATLAYGSENSNFIQWGNSGYYDPLRKEVGFIGKRDGPNQYHWLVYDEATNTWSNNRPMWDTNAYSGHGYDHNAIDPATGTVYFRLFGGEQVYAWNGSWSALSRWSQSTTVAGGLTWFPGVGLMYNDGSRLLRYGGSAWSQVAYFGGGSYHDMSEYNSTANVLIVGSGNGPSPMRKVDASLNVTIVADPPFNIGSSSTQGVCISDPNSASLIAYQKGTTNWAKYDIQVDGWMPLAQSSGDGSSPQSGTPNLVGGDTGLAVIGIPIPRYGVMMFIQYRGSGSTPADVWLYRHS